MNPSWSLPGYRNAKILNGVKHATTLSHCLQNPYQVCLSGRADVLVVSIRCFTENK